MGNEKTIPEKTRRLADTYLRISDEGRNILDIFIQALQETHGDPEEVNRITSFAFVEPLKGINGKEPNQYKV